MPALDQIFPYLPAQTPPIIVVIHLQPGMTRIYADMQSEKLKRDIREAKSGDILKPGQILIAPAGQHMKLVSNLGQLSVTCYVGEKVQHAIPSVDVMFTSVAEVAGADSIGVILTGIGADGADGLLKMRNKGAATIGQDEATCTVYGMPKVAKSKGAVQHELPIQEIAKKIVSLL